MTKPRRAHLIFHKVHLDFSAAERESAIEPVLGLLSILDSLVANEGESPFRYELEICDDRIFEGGWLREVVPE